MKKTLDYNSVDWDKYFYLSETSPSGLRRKISIYGGRKLTSLVVAKDSVAGNKRWKSSGKPNGWRLMMGGIDYFVHRIIYVLKHGSIDNTLHVDHLDGDPFNNNTDNLCIKTNQQNSHNQCKRSTNKSGVTGVYFSSQLSAASVQEYWVATWIRDGKSRSKVFSIKKLGHDQAFALAVAYRAEQITLLNAAGASYTERHRGLTPATPPAISPVQPT